jgi:hypothetical protein
MLSSVIKCYHLGCNIIIWSYSNVIIWCYHLMLSSGMITPPFFIFPENFTHSLSAQPASLRCLPFGSKLLQGIATMTYTRSHTRPSQKDLGCVVHPLNNKSLAVVLACVYVSLCNRSCIHTYIIRESAVVLRLGGRGGGTSGASRGRVGGGVSECLSGGSCDACL